MWWIFVILFFAFTSLLHFWFFYHLNVVIYEINITWSFLMGGWFCLSFYLTDTITLFRVWCVAGGVLYEVTQTYSQRSSSGKIVYIHLKPMKPFILLYCSSCMWWLLGLLRLNKDASIFRLNPSVVDNLNIDILSFEFRFFDLVLKIIPMISTVLKVLPLCTNHHHVPHETMELSLLV